MRNFTPEDLLEFYYGEMAVEDALELAESLKVNWPLREKLAVIREAGIRLDKSMHAPREKSVQAIMDYAAASLSISVDETH